MPSATDPGVGRRGAGDWARSSADQSWSCRASAESGGGVLRCDSSATDDRSGRIGSGRGLRLESKAFDARRRAASALGMAAPSIPTGESAADVENGSCGESASEESVMMPPYGEDVTLDDRAETTSDAGFDFVMTLFYVDVGIVFFVFLCCFCWCEKNPCDVVNEFVVAVRCNR